MPLGGTTKDENYSPPLEGCRGGLSPTGRTPPKAMPSTPEGVKKFRTGRDREGESPAEPHGARTSGDGSPGGSPSQFLHNFPRGDFHRRQL